MTRTNTQKLRIVEAATNVANGGGESDFEELIRAVQEVSPGRSVRAPAVLHSNDARPNSELQDVQERWLDAYRDAMTGLIHSLARSDPGVLSFVEEHLGGVPFPNGTSAAKWIEVLVERDGGPQPKPMPLAFNPEYYYSVIRLPASEINGSHGDEPVKFRLPSKPGQELSKLKELSVNLAHQFGWPEEWATASILIEVGPLAHPAYAWVSNSDSIPCLSKVHLELDPALPTDVVISIWNQYRSSTGRRQRPTIKALRLAEFASKRPDLKTDLDRWHEWNRLCDDDGVASPLRAWAYAPARKDLEGADSAYNNFRRDLRRAEDSIIGPELRSRRRRQGRT